MTMFDKFLVIFKLCCYTNASIFDIANMAYWLVNK